ncbi:MAG: hypothetical protein HY299_12300 [Verrucomicrobia bacterium]|nr:hypothetical protein [Verrucomicrobiota bacterium]
MEIAELKLRLRIADAWLGLNLPGRPGKCVASPFRKDSKPSFSVWRFPDGTDCFKDHSTGQSGDVIEFIRCAKGCDISEAIRWARDRAGGSRVPFSPAVRSLAAVPKVPPLRRGKAEEHRKLCELRGFDLQALQMAQDRGFLFFAELWGIAAWCLTDPARELYEFRRMDGRMWPAFGRLAERKAHCIGSGKSWPIGTRETAGFQQVVWVEGAPDFLAALHFTHREGKAAIVAPVAVLGAGNQRLSSEALAYFRGKRVCIYPHADSAGHEAMVAWARALKASGVDRVTAFDLSGLVKADGSQGKDLADVCGIGADCFETQRKFWEVIP